MTSTRHPARAWGWVWALACLGALLGPTPAHAEDPSIFSWLLSERHVQIVMRVLAYDQRLKRDDALFFRLAVISEIEDARSCAVSQSVVARIERQARQMTLAGRAVVVTGAPMTRDEQRLLATLGQDVHAIYLAPGLADPDVRRLVALAEKIGIGTITGDRSYERLGVAIVVTLEEDKPRVRVNLRASERAGMQLSSQVLQIADPIEDPAPSARTEDGMGDDVGVAPARRAP